jgi:hypothetical protein
VKQTRLRLLRFSLLESTTRALLHVLCMLYSMNGDPASKRGGCKTGEPRTGQGRVEVG